MLSIWKFDVPIQNQFALDLPVGARALSVGVQHGRPVMWVLLDTEEDNREQRVFSVRGTGHPIHSHSVDYAWARFIGTFQLLEGNFIGHLFDGAL